MIFHMMKGYYSHLIIKQVFAMNNKIRNRSIDAIPNSYENKVMTFSFGDLKFFDSFHFMASSIEMLVKNLYGPSDMVNNFTVRAAAPGPPLQVGQGQGPSSQGGNLRGWTLDAGPSQGG